MKQSNKAVSITQVYGNELEKWMNHINFVVDQINKLTF